MKKQKVITIDDQKFKDVQKDINNSNMLDSTKSLLLAILDIYRWLVHLHERRRLTLAKIKRLFGFTTEKTDKNKDKDGGDGKTGGKGSGGETGKRSPKKKPPKGHGRNGVERFKGAKKIFHKFAELKVGDLCPKCLKGKLHPTKPSKQVHFVGNPPVEAQVHVFDRLRCGSCNMYFTAKASFGLDKKYDPSVDVSIAMFKYNLGVPFYRLQGFQKTLGMPLSASVQWERCSELSDSLLPIYETLLGLASEGTLFHEDDTTNRIIDLKKKITEEGHRRTGIFTTGIISQVNGKDICLFFTGNRHAGENLQELLLRRKSESEIVTMSDALSRNLPKETPVIWANCLVHGRRGFWDLREYYPDEVRYVLKKIGQVYGHEALCKEKGFTPEKRLAYHQEHSKGILDDLRKWCLNLIEDKKVEPNEELAGAIKYFDNHYEKMTLFLERAGVPMDNNVLEAMLKIVIRGRKNSLFYKTQRGAFVGDMITSVIETCKKSGINPFKYLLSLHKRPGEVKQNPVAFLPWNIEALDTS